MKHFLTILLISASALKVCAQDAKNFASQNSQPVGTIITSVLDYDNFTKITGDPKVIDPKRSIWIPADGRSIAGSLLSSLTGIISAPDSRGRFLRGLNTIYNIDQPVLVLLSADSDDPSSNRKAGSYEGDLLKKHNHDFSHVLQVSDHEPHNTSGGFKHVGGGAEGYHNYSVTGENSDGGSETRPKNIGVYYYIKIN